MAIALLQIIGGFVLLVWGADRLVAGASATANNLGVSPLIIGLVVVGFGTSAPEIVVSAVASVNGNPALAVGNAIGSNIANVGLILGLTALIYPLKIESGTLKREYPILLLVMLLTTWLMRDYFLSNSDGLVLLGGLVLLIGGMVILGLKRSDSDPLIEEFEAEIPSDMSTSTGVLWLAVGLVVLPASSKVLVDGAVTVAHIAGVSDAIIGLTIVAFGTSLPELAAAVTSAIKHEDDIAIGNVIGSNMFNLLGVLGIAATLHPVTVDIEILHRDALVMYVFTLLLFFMAWGIRKPGRIARHEGALLLTLYCGYIFVVAYNALR